MNPIFWADMTELYGRKIDWRKLYKSKVMITGAYGMLASYTVFMLIYLNEAHGADIEIYALGRSRQKAEERFGVYADRAYFHFIPSDMWSLQELDVHPDYIIHAASYASSQYYGTDPVGVTVPNVFGTYQLCLKACERSIQSMLFLSSGEVYGRTDAAVIREDEIGISDPVDIRSCYGESKRMAECLLKCFQVQYGVPAKIVRLAHTYGPTMNIAHDKRVFSEFVGNIVRGENLLIRSNGRGIRVFLYIADAVAAFFHVLLDGRNGEVYNIANMQGRLSVADLAQELCSLFPEKGLRVEYMSRPQGDTYIDNTHTRHSVLDTGKLQQLGWRCQYSVQEGFRRTVEGLTTHAANSASGR